MNIIFLTRLYHPHVGGVEKHVERLSSELIKKGHSITVITEGYKENLKEEQIYKGVKIYRIPLWDIKEESKKFAIWEWLFAHRKLLTQADVVHVHDVAYWIFPLFLPKNKVFITFHGYEGSKPPKKSAILQRKMGEFISNKTINIGGFMKDWYNSKPDMVLYGAVGATKFHPKSKQAIYIGRLHEDTGIMTYLQALNILKKKNISISLDVYGEGPQMQKAIDYSKAQKLKVKFFGFVPNAAQYICKYRYAFVSRYLTLLEAMNSKVPIFAVYNNQIKHDYLMCHPVSSHFYTASNSNKLANILIKNYRKSGQDNLNLLRCYQWSKQQTWPALANKYIKLWK